MQLEVFSWNIWYNGNLEAVNDYLNKSKSDIIGLQEVMRTDKKIELSKKLTDELGYQIAYAPAFQIHKKGKTVDVGNAVLTKHTILKSQIHILSDVDSRVALQTDIQIKNTNKIIHVFNTHFLHTHQQPSAIQDLQAMNLAKILPHESTILTGDFNALPDSNAVKIISEVLQNTDANMLPTWSVYPEGCHVCLPQKIDIKLDNIFVSRDIKIKSFQVEDSKASDHLPISAIIEV